MEVNLHGRLICNSISMYCSIPTRLFLFLLSDIWLVRQFFYALIIGLYLFVVSDIDCTSFEQEEAWCLVIPMMHHEHC